MLCGRESDSLLALALEEDDALVLLALGVRRMLPSHFESSARLRSVAESLFSLLPGSPPTDIMLK